MGFTPKKSPQKCGFFFCVDKSLDYICKLVILDVGYSVYLASLVLISLARGVRTKENTKNCLALIIN